MYLDRSLYETIHFWKEPTEPYLMDEASKNDLDYDKLDENDGISFNIYDDKNFKETTEQRGENSITMSNIPKAYWSSLLNLEEIKKLPFELRYIVRNLYLAFREVDIQANRSQLVVVLGQTGDGKSTMLASIVCGPEHLEEVERSEK